MYPEIEKFTVSRNDGFMEGWPDLLKLQSGRILVIYNECTAHSNRNNTHITLRKSDDGGRSWSEKQYIGEETHQGDQWNSIRVSQLRDGRILLVCDRIAGHERSEETGFYLFESCDDGETWTDKRFTGIYGYCSDKVRELSDGSLLLCVSRFRKETGKSEILAHKSYDGGRSFTPAVKAAKSEHYTFIEPAALEMKNGQVAVFIREDSKKGYNGFLVMSSDGGNSFTSPVQIPVKGMHRPFAGYLQNGKILISYREHLAADRKYPDLRMCIFMEEELKEPEKMTPENYLTDHDRSENADQGYSAWTETEEGRILMVNYIVDDAPKAYIRGYRIRLS